MSVEDQVSSFHAVQHTCSSYKTCNASFNCRLSLWLMFCSSADHSFQLSRWSCLHRVVSKGV